ncbi:histidine kinase [Xaviernesmea oryzae]|uniref:histidine kinase n=1 Tax=Xaviernesmea oryzae TaxID=464029 RepID=A0A1Q9B313_9HYPH|nr:histidine kinase [Xaviernesmea oryzae]
MLDLILLKTGTGYVLQDAELSVLSMANVPAVARDLASCSGVADGESETRKLSLLKRQVLETRKAATTEIEIAAPTGLMTLRFDIEPIDGEEDGIVSIVSDVSDVRHRERVLKTLLRELSHRSKNLLAIIQGIATQTARQARSLDMFLVAFRGRIQSLASSQDLVTDSSWRGAFLFALAEKQFAAYWSEPGMPLTPTGIDAHLSPNAALHIGLALHELIVNSASHGAIAMGAASLTLDCFETMIDGRNALELVWLEHLPLPAPASESSEAGFARTVLERVVPIAIGGKAHYLTSPERIEYHLFIPQHEYEIITRLEE